MRAEGSGTPLKIGFAALFQLLEKGVPPLIEGVLLLEKTGDAPFVFQQKLLAAVGDAAVRQPHQRQKPLQHIFAADQDQRAVFRQLQVVGLQHLFALRVRNRL